MKTKSHFCVCVFIILLHYSLLTHSKFKIECSEKNTFFHFSRFKLFTCKLSQTKIQMIKSWVVRQNPKLLLLLLLQPLFQHDHWLLCTWRRRPWPSTIIPFGSSLREVSEKWKLQVFRMRWTKCWILRKMLNFWPFKMGNFGNFGTVLLDQNCQKSPILASKLPKLPILGLRNVQFFEFWRDRRGQIEEMCHFGQPQTWQFWQFWEILAEQNCPKWGWKLPKFPNFAKSLLSVVFSVTHSLLLSQTLTKSKIQIQMVGKCTDWSLVVLVAVFSWFYVFFELVSMIFQDFFAKSEEGEVGDWKWDQRAKSI